MNAYMGLLVELAGRYEVTSNRESGFGRYDVMLRPLRQGEDGIILEFKVHDPKEESSLEEPYRQHWIRSGKQGSF